MANIPRIAAGYRQIVIEMQRHFHMYPEVAWQEQKTSKTIHSALRRLGIPFELIAETGVLTTIEGNHTGKTIVLRWIWPPCNCRKTIITRTIETICGPSGLRRLPPMTGAEDFAFYLQKIPGAFVFLGGGKKTKGLTFPQHHESFGIDEQALEIGTALNAQYALDFLNTAAPS